MPLTAPPAVESLVHRWKDEITARRARAKADPLTDMLESCASELSAALASETRTELTTEEYAQRHRRADVTVRRWCRKGLIRCRRAGRGFLIPIDEAPPTFAQDDVTEGEAA